MNHLALISGAVLVSLLMVQSSRQLKMPKPAKLIGIIALLAFVISFFV